MVAPGNNLFRKEALERASSPERLDQLIQVVSPKKWLSLVAFGSLIGVGLCWSVFGRIPVTLTGRGVLVYPSQVMNLQAPSNGQIVAVNVQTGDRVKKGQIIATIDQSELQKQIQLAQAKLAELQVQDQDATRLQSQRNLLAQAAIAQQRQTIQQSLQTVQTVTPILRDKGLGAIQRDRQNLQRRLATLQDLAPTLQERMAKRQELFNAGAIPEDTVLQARQQYLDALAQINEAESQLKQLDVQEADAQRNYLQSVNSIEELQSRSKELDTQVLNQAEQDLAAATNRKKEIQETQRLIAQLELQLAKDSQIKSEYDGRIIELTAAPGQGLQAGMRIGAIAAQTPGSKLMNVAFLPVSEGKKVKDDMTVQITPTTVKREEFGGIMGKVTDISAFPVTQDGAIRLVGNPDILPGVMTEGPQLAVVANLEADADTFSGLRWSSSRGPEQQMTPGTTTTVRITVESRPPITFVMPILKNWTGL
ncbi:MAG: NHLP bacteriocin system secretion protein [Oculatellaceae cyanobacterium Prado106]|jgi:HlyD family secretion protein|nr:NHLP bacteriocin system secretion protein [Oculatellaceae cyanobacterium Prado106]